MLFNKAEFSRLVAAFRAKRLKPKLPEPVAADWPEVNRVFEEMRGWDQDLYSK